ncbi:hypothetical protein BLA50215_03309 [Burkholderia lata]|uniref:hypothetical protein n=1 Tax=Burkholderia lata (strain ATCC 17760 / DSM 23089 / LMG 22485 / NCIMB 9086 / R18194 / 383) TaxID=482957 RepID=UPI001452D986|nr:hypothetical protein [Burkholderia lata]VWD12116.1 hypothetical protein BLA50215_03309 [Burkholderia lata]
MTHIGHTKCVRKRQRRKWIFSYDPIDCLDPDGPDKITNTLSHHASLNFNQPHHSIFCLAKQINYLSNSISANTTRHPIFQSEKFTDAEMNNRHRVVGDGCLGSINPRFVPSFNGGRRRPVEDRAASTGLRTHLHTGVVQKDFHERPDGGRKPAGSATRLASLPRLGATDDYRARTSGPMLTKHLKQSSISLTRLTSARPMPPTISIYPPYLFATENPAPKFREHIAINYSPPIS